MKAFLKILELNLEGWERVYNVATIQETLQLLEWRCQLAKKDKNAILASQQVNYKPQQSKVSFDEEDDRERSTFSQDLRNFRSLDKVKANLSTSHTIPEVNLIRQTSEQ